MKMKNILYVFLGVVCFYLLSLSANATNVTNVQILDKNSINLVLSGSLNLPEGELHSDIKLFKDISIISTTKDIGARKLTLILSGSLQTNKDYTLLPILLGNLPTGGDDTLDFSTSSGTLIGKEILFPQGGSIAKIMIKDIHTVEVYLTQDISQGEFEFKLLNEIKIATQTYLANNISLFLSESIEEYSNYIVMLLSVKDTYGKDIAFDNSLYNFTSDSFVSVAVDLKTDVFNTSINTGAILSDAVPSLQNDIQNTPTSPKTQTGNVAEVALNSAHTPDTGAETGVLIFLTLTLNGFFFFRKNILKIIK